MDVGVFKSSRARLMAWIIVLPLVAVGVGLGSYALQRQSEWKLSQTKELAEVLPRLVQTKAQASDLLTQFREDSDGESIESEDQLISFLQEVAQRVGFTVDSIKVERRVADVGLSLPTLYASVKGTGSFDAIELYLGDVISSHPLFSESMIKLSQVKEYNTDFYRAELWFELILYHGDQRASEGTQ